MSKVWKKSDWSCVKTFPCHSDSVWDLKLHNTTVVSDDVTDIKFQRRNNFIFQATAGLDGTVIIYDFVSDFDIKIRCYIQVINFVIFCKVQKVYVQSFAGSRGSGVRSGL